MPDFQGNDLRLAHIAGPGRKKILTLPASVRGTHVHISGTTGTGKSKLLEHMIRQDILQWSQKPPNERCGLLLLDPHGSIYEDVLQWASFLQLDRPIVPIDLTRDDWVMSYNMLRSRTDANTSVVVGNLVKDILHAWGQGDALSTPLLSQWLHNTIQMLYENNLTLAEAMLLLSREQSPLRAELASALTSDAAQSDIQYLNSQKPRSIQDELGSTIRRLRPFAESEIVQCMFGNPEVSIDFGRAMEEGWIILVNLSQKGGKTHQDAASMLATVLLSDLWTAAQERGKKNAGEIKPFYLYVDEFQRFLTPTIAEQFDQARGFGVHMTLANQFAQQLRNDDVGEQIFNSVMETARTKIVFNLADRRNLEPMADWLFRGTFNPDEVKHRLYSTKVVDYREEYRTAYSRGSSTSTGSSTHEGSGYGESQGHSNGLGESTILDADGQPVSSGVSLSAADSFNSHFSSTYGYGESESYTESESETQVPMLIPIMGQELSSIQYRSLEEQLERAMAVLFDLENRQCVARCADSKVPVSLFTPDVETFPESRELEELYWGKLMKKWDFALPYADARANLEDRKKNLPAQILNTHSLPEPISAKLEL